MKKCLLCEKGFPLLEGKHIPTQRLGMIPVTKCPNAKVTKPKKLLRPGGDIEIVEMAYHRNGIGGNGFFAFLFQDPENGLMVASVFKEPGSVSVFNVARLSEITDTKVGSVGFGYNSWRGDHYEPALRAEIKKKGGW